jgi:3-isopropylmalate/(R)-2-methylmalate dehydratase small subunit
MKAFTQHRGVAAPLLRINIDTDTIIPSREMKRVSKQGLSDGLFASWRYSNPDERVLNPDFILNQASYANSSILLGGDNFGCGSSREHAAWALMEYGIRCIIAPGFGSIFYQNCIRNGILPITLSDEIIKNLAMQVSGDPQECQLNIDLEQQQLTSPDGEIHSFTIENSHKEMLLKGLDPIALTLTQEQLINQFEKQDRLKRRWAYLD